MIASRPPYFSWVSPYLILKNPEKTMDFYINAFGFRVKETMKDTQGKAIYLEAFYQDQLILFGKENSLPGDSAQSPLASGIACPIHLYIYCENVDRFYQHALQHGAKSILSPQTMPWGDRVCRLADPENYHWAFATYQFPCQQNLIK